MQAPAFDKYATMGAYHWRECDPKSCSYNPPLAARYAMIAARVKGGRVLDVGAGDGYLAGQVAPNCDSVVALEYEPSGVELAQAMLADFENVEVMQGNTYAMPFPDGSFDVVMMADVIEHLEDPERAAREIARVLSDGGAAYVSTPQWRPDRIWDKRHVKEFRPEELRQSLASAFGEIELRFAWPRIWSETYRTKVGWRLLKWAGRAGPNPFTRESGSPEGFCQMLAIAKSPRR